MAENVIIVAYRSNGNRVVIYSTDTMCLDTAYAVLSKRGTVHEENGLSIAHPPDFELIQYKQYAIEIPANTETKHFLQNIGKVIWQHFQNLENACRVVVMPPYEKD